MSEINITQIDNVKETDIVIPMNNLLEYSDNFLKYLEVYGITTEINHF